MEGTVNLTLAIEEDGDGKEDDLGEYLLDYASQLILRPKHPLWTIKITSEQNLQFGILCSIITRLMSMD